MKNTEAELIASALKARERAYVPYSHFAVGAALEASDGTIYLGCNIENAAYPATICAERTALCAAVADGKRSFTRIAIVGAPVGETIREACPPCGVCRQMLSEFCDPEQMLVLLPSAPDTFETLTLSELLPRSFTTKNLIK